MDAFNYSSLMYRIEQNDPVLASEYLEIAEQCYNAANGRFSKEKRKQGVYVLAALSRLFPCLSDIYDVSILRCKATKRNAPVEVPAPVIKMPSESPALESAPKKWDNARWKGIYQHLLDVDEEVGHPEHFEIPTLDTGIDYSILPAASGIYLLGDTRFNPNTDAKFCSVKGGLASNLRSRIKEQYLTHNPMPYLIGYLEVPADYMKKVEDQIHYALRRVATHRYGTNKEWYELPKDIYMDICAEQFDWFLR